MGVENHPTYMFTEACAEYFLGDSNWVEANKGKWAAFAGGELVVLEDTEEALSTRLDELNLQMPKRTVNIGIEQQPYEVPSVWF